MAEQRRRPSLEAATFAALQRAAELVEEGTADELMDIGIHLPEEFFDFERLRGASDEQRNALWSERVQQLEASQGDAQKMVEALGGTLLARLQAANIVYARLPARSLEPIAENDRVVGIELDGLSADGAGAEGVERRNALAMNNDGYQSYGIDGSDGRGADGTKAVRFAVIEVETELNALHYSFKNNATTSRIVSVQTCDPGCYPPFTGLPVTEIRHGTTVASVLLSDFADGQQPGLSGSPAEPWGGIAPEGALYYYYAPSNAGVAAAINHAISQGVDIINISFQTVGTYCISSLSQDGILAAVTAAEDAGILSVAIAGNHYQDTSGCSVSVYGAYWDTLTVGGTENVTSLGSLAAVPTFFASGSNLVSQTTQTPALFGGPYTLKTRMIDLTANAYVYDTATTGTAGYTTSSQFQVGTSFSAPQVAGAAGLLKDWAWDTGGIISDWRNTPYVLRAMLAAMGDGAYSEYLGSETSKDVDERLGFGHLRFKPPDWNHLGVGSFFAVDWYGAAATNDVYDIPVGVDDGPEPSSMQGWKFAAVMDVNSELAMPSMLFQLIDKCPPGGGEVVLKVADRVTLKGRLRMKASEMATKYRGRCLFVRAKVDVAPSNFPLIMAQYGYTNDRIWHDM